MWYKCYSSVMYKILNSSSCEGCKKLPQGADIWAGPWRMREISWAQRNQHEQKRITSLSPDRSTWTHRNMDEQGAFGDWWGYYIVWLKH